jgi:hypothetical protein
MHIQALSPQRVSNKQGRIQGRSSSVGMRPKRSLSHRKKSPLRDHQSSSPRRSFSHTGRSPLRNYQSRREYDNEEDEYEDDFSSLHDVDSKVIILIFFSFNAEIIYLFLV